MPGLMHRVFVSSTFLDLAQCREAVQKSIRQLGAVDISMEHLGARDERPLDECVRLLREGTDSFVGIYAHRYGFVPEGKQKSITELELEAAAELKVPRFIYMIEDDEPWNPQHIEQGEGGRKLGELKRRLSNAVIVKRFRNKDQLAANVAADLGRHLAMQQLQRVDAAPAPQSPAALATADEWAKHRSSIYEARRGVFLVHSLVPSRTKGQLFDIHIYLQQHEPERPIDVKRAEFFLGRHWENRIFSVVNDGGLIGITVSAFGQFLCTCRVFFNDGTQVDLDRYIDFGLLGTLPSGPSGPPVALTPVESSE